MDEARLAVVAQAEHGIRKTARRSESNTSGAGPSTKMLDSLGYCEFCTPGIDTV